MVIILSSFVVLAELNQARYELQGYDVQFIVFYAEMVVADLEHCLIHEDFVGQILLREIHQVRKNICDFFFQLISSLPSEQKAEDSYQLFTLYDLSGRQLMASNVGYKPTGISFQLEIINSQQLLQINQNIILYYRQRILIFLSNDITDYSYTIFRDIDITQPQRLNDTKQNIFFFSYCRHDLVIFVIAEFIQRFKDYFVLIFNKGEELFNRDFLLVYMIDEDPQLFFIDFDYFQNVVLLSYNLISRCNCGHFSDILRTGAQVQ